MKHPLGIPNIIIKFIRFDAPFSSDESEYKYLIFYTFPRHIVMLLLIFPPTDVLQIINRFLFNFQIFFYFAYVLMYQAIKPQCQS